MSRTKEIRWGWRFAYAAATMLAVLGLCLFTEHFSIVSHAQSQGKVKKTVNIRKEANKSSEVLGSALENANVTINHQMKADDGTIWYQVFVDSDTLGYIRSDYIDITDGTTPPTKEPGTTTSTPPATSTTTTTPPASTTETPAQVEELNPVSASVKGGQAVNVRSNASTTSQKVTKVQSGMALTVSGKATGTDGNVWYRVNFIDNGSEVSGFIRSDYVLVSGELVPAASEEPPAETEPPVEPEPEEPVETKDYDTKFQNGKWYLMDYKANKQYDIENIFDVGKSNEQLYNEEHKKVSSQKIAIIIMVILMVAMAGVIAFLIFKLKDMTDDEYFLQVERNTVRRRGGERPQGGSRGVMHTVGTEKKRPAGASSAQGGQRPAGGQRPMGASPAQGGQRPAGGQRPMGASPAQGGQRPAGGQRPMGASPAQGGQRPAGGQRPMGASPAQGGNTPKPGWKSKNFMQDDDEFEFEFLNWNGEEDL